MSALQQDEVGTAGLAHRAAQWGSSLQLLNQWTGRKGYRLTIAVADLKLGLLEISTIFVPFRQNRSTRLKSLSCISFLRHFSLPHPLFFFFFHIKVEGSLCHVWKLQREGQNMGAVFSLSLRPPPSPKRMHSCEAHTQTHWSF